jgi:serine/threonine-protein kinase
VTPPDNGARPDAVYADDAGRYLLESRIATGGMGEVWRARDTALGRDVAVKLLKPELAGDPVFRARFEAEARHAARLQHPGIAAVFDVGEQMTQSGDVRPFLVMELVDGRPLSALIRPGVGMDPAVVRDLLAQAGDALAAAHAAGIVHRDLKPDNLMLRKDGSLALADFGIAKHVAMLITDTAHGEVVGTPYYLSPEQALGQPVDARCDIYSLGVLAYELLTGRKPYHATSAQELLHLHIHAPVPLLPPEHAHLQAVMESMMAKDREQRYPSARTLLADLEQMGL